jgi:predicted phosphoribosyltransferase
MQDLKFQHVSGHYKNFTKMSHKDFYKLLTMIGQNISKTDTRFRFSISILDK